MLYLNSLLSLSILRIGEGYALVEEKGTVFLYTETKKIPLAAEADFVSLRKGKILLQTATSSFLFSLTGKLLEIKKFPSLQGKFLCALDGLFGEYCFRKRTKLSKAWGWNYKKGYLEIWRRKGEKLIFISEIPFPQKLRKIIGTGQGFVVIGSGCEEEGSKDGIFPPQASLHFVGFSGVKLCSLPFPAKEIFYFPYKDKGFVFYKRKETKKAVFLKVNPLSCRIEAKLKILSIPGPQAVARVVKTQKEPRLFFITSSGDYFIFGRFLELLAKGKFNLPSPALSLKIESDFALHRSQRNLLFLVLSFRQKEKKPHLLLVFSKDGKLLRTKPSASPIIFPSKKGNNFIIWRGNHVEEIAFDF